MNHEKLEHCQMTGLLSSSKLGNLLLCACVKVIKKLHNFLCYAYLACLLARIKYMLYGKHMGYDKPKHGDILQFFKLWKTDTLLIEKKGVDVY